MSTAHQDFGTAASRISCGNHSQVSRPFLCSSPILWLILSCGRYWALCRIAGGRGRRSENRIRCGRELGWSPFGLNRRRGLLRIHQTLNARILALVHRFKFSLLDTTWVRLTMRVVVLHPFRTGRWTSRVRLNPSVLTGGNSTITMQSAMFFVVW